MRHSGDLSRRGLLAKAESRNDAFFCRFWFLPYALLILAVFAIYSNVYDNQFLLDDEFLIIKNQFLRYFDSLGTLLVSSSTAGSGGVDSFYRPMQGLLYFIVFQFSDTSTTGFHLLNVALHAANACLMYMLGNRLGFHKTAAITAALLWAAHPIQTEAITYMSATADPLYAFFCLLGLCVLSPSFSPARIFASCFIFALALLSKETAIVFPALAIVCLFLVNGDRFNPKSYLKTWPLWLVAGLYMLLRITVLNLGDFQFYKQPNIYSENITVRLFTCLATLPYYVRVFLWPSDLHMQRDFPVFIDLWEMPVMFGATLVLAAIGYLIWTKGRKGLSLAWGISWFGVAHFLHTGVFLAVNSLFLEHWLYLPTVGIMLGTSQTLATWRTLWTKPIAKSAAIIAITLTTATLGWLTFQQNKTWHDPIQFYENILNYGERSASAHNNLAMAYTDKGEPLKAIEHYRKAISLYDVFPQTHHNLALALLSLSDGKSHVDEAIKELERAIEINPKFFQSYGQLASIYSQSGDTVKAKLYNEKQKEILRQLFP